MTDLDCIVRANVMIFTWTSVGDYADDETGKDGQCNNNGHIAYKLNFSKKTYKHNTLFGYCVTYILAYKCMSASICVYPCIR